MYYNLSIKKRNNVSISSWITSPEFYLFVLTGTPGLLKAACVNFELKEKHCIRSLCHPSLPEETLNLFN